MKKTNVSFIILTAVTLMSCAKEKPLKTVYKNAELTAKTSFKTHREVIQKDGSVKKEPIKYLYVPMTLGTPMQVRQANPFYQGDEKIVRLEWSPVGLKVLEMELDERYADNGLNDTPVMTIPGDYMSFKCKEDAYGECKNEEEEDKDREWYEKSMFKPNFSELTVEEVNMLDLANVNGDSCVTPKGVKLVDYELSDGVINIELEKTYQLKNSWKCIASNYYEDKLSYNAFKVRFFYSMVELDQLATPGYQPVNYPITDHSVFGYFKNEKEILEDNFDSRRKKEISLLNRWAPQRKNNELVYYLSKSFNKEKNKPLLEATLRATRVMNKGFAKANMPFKLKMVQQDEDSRAVSPGDLRYNTVVLIDDPLANGLLGYGPSVSNPLTGEIVQAHTNMYGGVLTSTVRRVYESAVDLTIERSKKAAKVLTDISVEPSAIANLPKSLLEAIVPTGAPSTPATNTQAAVVNGKLDHNEAQFMDIDAATKDDVEHFLMEEKSKAVNHKMSYKNLLDSNFEGLSTIEKQALKEEAKEFGHNLNTKHSPEFFEIGGTIKKIPEEILKVAGIKNTDGTLKRWSVLTKAQKDEVQQIILVHSYTATFVHELGHNLGLRHNFNGSWDKDNFYTKKEAAEMGMKEAPAYSSIMDYSFSEFNQLATFGKYDIAALRFGYAREVMTKAQSPADKPKAIKVTTSYADAKAKAVASGLELKEYAFCTDENAGLATTCNRFDEGTSLVEVATHKAKRYEDAYKYRNFRDGKRVFNSYGLPSYVIQRYREFKAIRDIVEDYQSFVELLGPEIMASGCSADQANNPANANICKMIKDRIDSAVVVGKMFVKILKTPDLTCAVANAAQPNRIVALDKLATVYDSVKYSASSSIITSCFHKDIEAYYQKKNQVVVGENGKYLNSVRGVDPRNKYASDRDIRGVWADKALAMRMLFDRVSDRGSNDTNLGALVDIPAIASEVGPFMSHMVLGTPLSNPLPFKTKDGQEFIIPYVLGNDMKIDQVESYFGWIKYLFNMPANGSSNLSEVILKQSGEQSLSLGDDILNQAYAMTNFASVRRFPSLSVVNKEADGVLFTTVGDIMYSATKENQLASVILATVNKDIELKALATKCAKYKNVTSADGSVTTSGECEQRVDVKAILTRVLKQRTAPEVPAEIKLPTDLQVYFTLDQGTQELLINYANQNAPITEEQFVGAFGEVVGKQIFIAYGRGAQVMSQVLGLKLSIINTVPADIVNKDVKAAYASLIKMNIQVLRMFAEGKVDKELIDYYRGQLKRMPNHKQYYNI